MIGIVTKLVKKNNYVQIFIDETYFCSVTEDTLAGYRLFVGKSLDDSLQDTLQKQSNIDKLYNKLLRLISTKLYSRKELIKQLKEYANKFEIDYDESIIESLLTKVSGLELFNERKNMQTICTNYQNKNKGKNYISQKLFEKGFPKDIIKELITDIHTDKSDIDALLEKKYQTLKKSEPDKRKIQEKLTRFGLGRGFSYDELKEPIKRILQHT